MPMPRLSPLTLLLPLTALSQPAPPAPAASAVTDAAQRVEVTGGRQDDTTQRRQSTAAKIIVGRDEIDRFGDGSTSEVLKRLPGVTLSGPPGRAGAVALRGLGGGYTQILVDGERMPAGFSVDSIAPEQIERIEILRAPTAETGAQAIAGTINIVMREGFRRRRDELRLATQLEAGHLSPSASWTHNRAAGSWTSTLSLSASRRVDESDIRDSTSAPGVEQRTSSHADEQRNRLHASGRLQWRGESGNTVLLTPLLLHSSGSAQRAGTLEQPLGDAPYARFVSDGGSRFTLARLSAQHTRRLADGARLEGRVAAGGAHWVSHALRHEFDAAGGLSRELADRTHIDSRDATGSLKFSKLLDDGHDIVAGAEAEAARRVETRSTVQDGTPLLAAFDGGLRASTLRLAAYAQDEWALSPHWSVHAGLRGESLSTEGRDEHGMPRRNRSTVVSPLLHAVWKPDPKGRDQLRLSLTRSYKAPTWQNLMSRPTLNVRAPVPGPNTVLTPDRAGNPGLKPELASGIDLAVERYLGGGGLLSVNLFHRRIGDLIRSVTVLEDVSWAAEPRYVSRPQNIGGAVAQGIELEARFRLSDVIDGSAPVDLRSNLSLFRSRVKSVPGPDNRLDQQPDATANLGADYRLRSLPLTVGGTLNWTPGYDTRLSEVQSAGQGRKLVFDAFALWRFDEGVQLRLSASNLAALDYGTVASAAVDGGREVVRTTEKSYVNWQLRLEMRM